VRDTQKNKNIMHASAQHRRDQVRSISELRKTNPNVLFIIERSKNLNVVVYEAVLDPKTGFLATSADCVCVYWLDIDPKHNHKGDLTKARCELNFLERSKAYGISISKKGASQSVAVLAALKQRPITVIKKEASGNPTATIKIREQQCELHSVYVHAPTSNFIGIPTVEYVLVTGINEEGQPLEEKILPEGG
jgi:hypothetical protein